MTRGLMVFVLASLVSWSVAEVADWTQEKLEESQPAAQTPDNLSQLLNMTGQKQPYLR